MPCVPLSWRLPLRPSLAFAIPPRDVADVNGLLQGISSTGLKGTLGRIAAGMAISQTSDLLVWRGPSAASEIERTFLEAPYSQVESDDGIDKVSTE